jgi:hypothetical protein
MPFEAFGRLMSILTCSIAAFGEAPRKKRDFSSGSFSGIPSCVSSPFGEFQLPKRSWAADWFA